MKKNSALLIGLLGMMSTGVALAGGTVRRAPVEAPAEVAPAPAPAPAPEVYTPAPAPAPVVVSPVSESGFYAGGAIGRSTYSGTTQISPTTFEAPGNGTGGKIFAGYQFNRNFAAEASYVNLGSSGSVRGQGGAIDAVGILPVGSNIDIYGRLGVADMKAGGGLDDRYKVGGHYGIGAAYHFTPNLSARVEAEHFQKVGPDLSANLYTVGVAYKF
jgi:OmpA-OmpF porin, OOP family